VIARYKCVLRMFHIRQRRVPSAPGYILIRNAYRTCTDSCHLLWLSRARTAPSFFRGKPERAGRFLKKCLRLSRNRWHSWLPLHPETPQEDTMYARMIQLIRVYEASALMAMNTADEWRPTRNLSSDEIFSTVSWKFVGKFPHHS
jgi:hypothetical protein